MYVYRVGAYPSLRLPDIKIDDASVFSPPELGYTWVYVKGGERSVQVDWPWDIGAPDLRFSRRFDAGSAYYRLWQSGWEPMAAPQTCSMATWST